MDTSAVRDVVKAHIRPLRHALCLNDWTIDVTYDSLDPGNLGRVSYRLAYRDATITLDPQQLGDPAAVVRVLAHGLIHLVLAPVVLLLDTSRSVAVPGPTAIAAIDESYSKAIGLMVGNVERMLDGVGKSPLKLSAGGAKQLAGWDHRPKPRKPRSRRK